MIAGNTHLKKKMLISLQDCGVMFGCSAVYILQAGGVCVVEASASLCVLCDWCEARGQQERGRRPFFVTLSVRNDQRRKKKQLKMLRSRRIILKIKQLSPKNANDDVREGVRC